MQEATMRALARTEAVRRALRRTGDRLAVADLLFLESWETRGKPDIAATLRAAQIRRANPVLAEEIHAELTRGRPLSASERAELGSPEVPVPALKLVPS